MCGWNCWGFGMGSVCVYDLGGSGFWWSFSRVGFR